MRTKKERRNSCQELNTEAHLKKGTMQNSNNDDWNTRSSVKQEEKKEHAEQLQYTT